MACESMCDQYKKIQEEMIKQTGLSQLCLILSI